MSLGMDPTYCKLDVMNRIWGKLVCLLQWCRRRGYKRNPKSFCLSKIWTKSLKIRAKSLKILAKWRTTLFNFKKWRLTFAEKHTKTFFWRS